MTTKEIYINLKTQRGSSSQKALIPDETDKLLHQLKKDTHRMILILGAFAGLRAEEICQCRFNWLEKTKLNEQESLRINIPAQDRDSRNKLKKWNTKKSKARTTYIFENDLINEVYFWFKNNPNGLMISRQAIDKAIRVHFIPIIERDNFSTHALRSTAQNYLRYKKQFPTSVIQIMLGHSDIRTTEKHYNSLTKASAESYLQNNL